MPIYTMVDVKLGVLLAVTGVALVCGGYAAAATRSLRSDARLDAVASGIAGFPVSVSGEDDPAAWAADPATSQGQAGGYSAPLAVLGDPLYHREFLAPDLWGALEGIESAGLANVSIPGRYEAAVAIMALTHEAFHLRLSSTDEGRVNACALQAFPDVISTYFGVMPTIEQTSTMTKTVKVRRRVWVRVNGRRVRRWRLVPRTVTTTSTAEVANPVYNILVDNARASYEAQPPPYSTGTCS